MNAIDYLINVLPNRLRQIADSSHYKQTKDTLYDAADLIDHLAKIRELGKQIVEQEKGKS